MNGKEGRPISMRFLRKWMILFLLLGLVCVSASAETLSVERQVYNYLTQEMGLPSASACGVLANMEHESAFNPGAVGDNGTSYGLCQWHAVRYSALKTYCLAGGLDYRTVEGQMEYLQFELETNYASLLLALKGMENSASGAYRAGYLWCTDFEVPEDTQTNAVKRGNMAKGKYWNRYNSIVIMEVEEEPLTQEKVLEIIQQTEVTVPQPPEGTKVERYEEEEKVTLPTSPYIPRHRPAREKTVHPATAFAAAILFMPLSEGKKEGFSLESPENGRVEV